MLTKEALQYVLELGLESRNLHENNESVFKALRNADGTFNIQELTKDPVTRDHKFMTLEGFLDYIESDHCDTEGIIFVSPDSIFADLEYGAHGKQQISLELDYSEEYKAFLSICYVSTYEPNFIPQKELWRILISSLDGAIDPALLLQVQGIGLGQSNKAKFEIDNSGITSTNKTQQVSITVSQENKESKTAPFLIDWTWKGRIWECFNPEYEIKFRVEIYADDEGIGFICHPKKMQTVLRQARQDLVSELKSAIPCNLIVFEGQYK